MRDGHMDSVYFGNGELTWINVDEIHEIEPVFKGTEDEVIAWLADTHGIKGWRLFAAMGSDFWVHVSGSESLMHVSQYLVPEKREAVRESRRKRFDAILELVREAIDVQDPNAHACEITEKIMKVVP